VGLTFQDGGPTRYDSGNYPDGLAMALEMIGASDFRRRQREARRAGRYLGLGLGCYVEGTGIGPYEGAHVRVEPSGKVLVATGLTTQGQGHGTTFAQIAAEALGCDPVDVSVVTGDTTKFNWGAGTYASRGLVTSGNAIHRAATTVREKALRLAASLLEVSPHDLELADGRARVKGVPGKELTLGALATVANPIRYAYGKESAEAALRLVKPREGAVLLEGEEPGLEARGYYAPPHSTFASGCHAAIVEVDVETGNLTFLRYVVHHDCGTLVNPTIVEGQIRGGVAQGVGGSFYERIIYDAGGQPLTATLMDFLLPTALEVPEIEIGHTETPSPLNALGIKGVGEAGAIPVPALVAEAIDDALAPLGVRVREMPLDPDRLLQLIRVARGGSSSRGGGGSG
jgi:CO/xanthine dehydrogenase Mo-binding subunit